MDSNESCIARRELLYYADCVQRHNQQQAMQKQGNSRVRLVNMVFHAYHGVLKEEHTIGTRYEVDIELCLDFTIAAQHDDINKTVDYASVYQKIKDCLNLQIFYVNLVWMNCRN